ncbi:MAG: heavy-metal-associated domain-containing protein [Desulfobacteraceae bacterium]
MTVTRLRIPNISCAHCVKTIEQELEALEGVTEVKGDVGAKSISVEWDAPADLDRIKAALEEINYPAAEIL